MNILIIGAIAPVSGEVICDSVRSFRVDQKSEIRT